MVRGQIEAVMDDLQPVAIKIGMINDIQIVRVISDCLQKYSPAYVGNGVYQRKETYDR